MTAFDLGMGSTVSPDESLIRFEDVPSYAEFQERCLLPNRPCIFPPGLIAHWPVVQNQAWALLPSSGQKEEIVNWAALKQAYPTHTSPVVITRTTPDGETQEERTEMTISAAIKLISDFKLNKLDDGRVKNVYIKDWHLIKQLSGQSVEPYTVPEVFADDWMNNVPSGEEGKEVDDFRFVYAGTTNSQTLLHRDVYTSYSWSSNVIGRKRWYLIPPRSIPHLRRFPNVSTSELIPDIQTLLSTITTRSHSAQERTEYPHLHQAYTTIQVIDQAQGETIFIPSNWYHQVENLTEAISINRNWCNSVNLPSLYQSIVDELQHVEENLCDVKEMLSSNSSSGTGEGWKEEFYRLVQDVAIQDAGWAWAGFWDMVVYNLKHPAKARESRPKDGWVRERLRPLVEDFAKREDARWLDQKILETAKRCKIILEATGD
ncbi:uncharacterized protein UTRI_00410 [Ustilago trichophora]|uniref:JmjC domain-containing protein n=1 Tax=Ustilago trichophora TaxID=86804 RepID=A0A5C3DR71_9BASI|nr:uncharacterized protein UTRI_00410 [Ustilago trichophora]